MYALQRRVWDEFRRLLIRKGIAPKFMSDRATASTQSTGVRVGGDAFAIWLVV